MADIENNGGNWIKLNRSIWDNFIWSFEKPQYTLAWIDILLMANYKDKKILFDGKVEVIKRGTFITSMVKLAERWDMNRETVKRFLDLLQNEGMITYSSSNRRTAINVVNYGVFQQSDDKDPATEPAADPAAEPTTDPATEPAADPAQHKKVKKVKESKEIKNTLSNSKELDCSTDVQRIIQSWNGIGLSQIKKIVEGTNRFNMLNKRIKDYGIDTVLQAIAKIPQSDFLMGKGNDGWVITFDWFIKPNNFPKVLGGNYDNNQTPPKSSTGGRKEIEPDWLNKDREQAFDARMRRDMEQLAEFERTHKIASDDP